MVNNDDHVIKEALELLSKDKNAVFADVLTAQIDEAVDEIKGDSTAYVESATELTSEERVKLESVLDKRFEREMNVVYTVDKKLLGGFRVRVGDWKLDDTLVYRIQQMKEALIGGLNG